MLQHRRNFLAAAIILSAALFLLCGNKGIITPETYDQLKINMTEDSLDEALNSRIPEMMRDYIIPGLQMAVIKNDEMIWSGSHGVKNAESGDAVDEQSIFQAASLSKTVFAYAVLKLVENGSLELDLPLISYVTPSYIINQFNNGRPLDDRIHEITARMVLTHSTGFPNWRTGDAIGFIYEPGERFSYSGEGFFFLQRIIEHISGKTLNELMTELVFNPLGMSSSSYIWKAEMELHITNGHQSLGQVNPVVRPSTGNAAATLLTTAGDYSKFILALINATGIQEATIDSMLTTQIQAPITLSNHSYLSGTISWGLGIGLQETEFGRAFWHWGDNGDFKCFTITYPEEKIGLVYFTNSTNGLLPARELVQLTLGGRYPVFDWLGY